jgi:hypothetical protein
VADSRVVWLGQPWASYRFVIGDDWTIAATVAIAWSTWPVPAQARNATATTVHSGHFGSRMYEGPGRTPGPSYIAV